jgi:glucose-1-phosphate cytidylyltransferase
MKVVILAGGYGTRISEHTNRIPKPMIEIGGKPILWHIMKHYSNFGHKDFYIALGYKSEAIKDYFINYKTRNSNFEIDLKTGQILFHDIDSDDWKVTLVDTGVNTMTGGRIKRLENYLNDTSFLLTYGDGLCNVDINELINFHKNHKKIATVTAVHPSARFGELSINKNQVISFKEKPQVDQGWINGGFFVLEPKFLDYISDDNTILEREPLEQISSEGELMAHCHEGFWQCMDTLRDKEVLENLWESGERPWLKEL